MKAFLQEWCRCKVAVLLLLVVALAGSCSWAQVPISFERQRMKQILMEVKHDIDKNFYDPSLKGLNWPELVNQARERIEKANNVSQMLTAIFVLVDKLHDSHTKFLPPQRVDKVRFGFEAKAFGDEIRIYELKKEGAAAAAGLQLGDRILSVNGFNADRQSFDLMMLYFRALRPVTAMEMDIQRGNGPVQKIHVPAKVIPGKLLTDLTTGTDLWELIREIEADAKEEYPYHKGEDGIGYMRLPSFGIDEGFFSRLFGKVKDSKAIIVDLRGNLGGRVDTLTWAGGYFTRDDTVIGDVVRRDKTEPMKIKPHNDAFRGPMFVLVDSESSSAAEIFARHFQRAGRAKVIGDRTSGRVTVARFFPHRSGQDTVIFYGVQIGVGRLILPGGEELEGRGVVPDIYCVPSGEELRGKHDRCRTLAHFQARLALGLPEKPR